MIAFLILLLHVVVSPFKTQARLEAEIIMLRHQLNVLRRRVPSKPRLTVSDRLLFVWLYRLFPSVLNAVAIVQPETIIRWHRAGFRLYWRWKSRSRGGRPRVPIEIRRLIREMSLANRLWGAPRIHGELLKLGIEVAQSTVAKYMAKSGRGRVADLEDLSAQPCGRRRRNGLPDRADGRFQLLFVLVILRHQRRRLISLSVTAHPTAEWIARQITDAFPWDEAPDYMIRDRDASLRSSSHQAPYGDGNTRSSNRPTVTLAERACGETDRLDPPRMPRSHRRLRRGPSASDTCDLHRILQ